MRGSLVAQRAVADHQFADTELRLQRSRDPDDHETRDAECGVLLNGDSCERCSHPFENGDPNSRPNPVDVGVSVQGPGVLPGEVLPPATTEDKDQTSRGTGRSRSSHAGPVAMELFSREERSSEMLVSVLGNGHAEPKDPSFKNSVAGRRFSFNSLERVTVCPADELLPRLEEAVRVRILEERPLGGGRSVNPLSALWVRETFYDEITLVRRATYHANAARVLESFAGEGVPVSASAADEPVTTDSAWPKPTGATAAGIIIERPIR